MFNVKEISAIQAEAALEGDSGLKRILGPWQLIALGIGCIIGAGIFVMTGEAAQVAGPALVLSFVLSAVACGFAGLCYAELASVIPVSGSAYTYSYATLGEIVAWVVGWCLVLEYGVASSTVAVGWSGYFVSFLKDYGVAISPIFTQPYGTPVTLADGSAHIALFNLPAFVSMMIVTGILMLGIRESAALNNIMVAIKTTVIVIFIAVGAFYILPENWTPFIPVKALPDGTSVSNYGGIVGGAALIFFAYIGFDAVSTAAQEAKNPQRDMPIGILGSLVICTVLYMAVALVMTGVVDYHKLGVPDPLAVAVDAMKLQTPDSWLLTALVKLVKIGAIIGLFSVMLVCTYGQIRIAYVMARDGLLPKAFCKVNEKTRTPILNTFLCGLLIAVIAATMPLSALGTLVSMGTLLAFTIVCVGVVYLRRTQPELPRPFRCPGVDTRLFGLRVPLVPIGGIFFCLYVMLGLPLTADLIFPYLHWNIADVSMQFSWMKTPWTYHGLKFDGGLPLATFEHFSVWLAAGMALYFLYGMRRSEGYDPKLDFKLRPVVGILCLLFVGWYAVTLYHSVKDVHAEAQQAVDLQNTDGTPAVAQ